MSVCYIGDCSAIFANESIQYCVLDRLMLYLLCGAVLRLSIGINYYISEFFVSLRPNCIYYGRIKLC